MLHDFAITAAQTDIPQVGAARKYGTKKRSELKTKELPRTKSLLPKITTKNEDQTMDQNNGLEVKISKTEIRITIMMDLQEIFLHLIETSRQSPTSYMKTITRTIEDHMTNPQISHSIEAMETDPEMDLSTIRTETGGIMETFLVLHQIQEETSHKIIPISNQEVINLTTLRSADLTIDLRLALRPMNRNFRRTINIIQCGSFHHNR